MDPAWIAAISALGGVAVGALAEALRARASFRREKAWEVEEERRRHLEEVYEALDHVGEAYALLYGEALAFASAAPVKTSDTPRIKVPWSRLRMLVHLYLPELKGHLAIVERAGPALGSAAADVFMRGVKDPNANEPLVARMDRARVELTQSLSAMGETIAAMARSISQQRRNETVRRRITIAV